MTWKGWEGYVPVVQDRHGDKFISDPIRPSKCAKCGPSTTSGITSVQCPITVASLCEMAGLPRPEAEFKFHPVRRWKFDYAWPDSKVALEVQGGLFIQGRHSRGAALLKEHEKLNTAAAMGWRILFTTPDQLLTSIDLIKVALGASSGRE